MTLRHQKTRLFFIFLLNVVVINHCWGLAGELDPTFGVGGKMTVDLAGIRNDGIVGQNSTLIQPDGKIIVAGGGRGYAGRAQTENVILRFNADGTPDASFGNNGEVHVQFFSGSTVRGLALQKDGKIIVGLITSTIEGYVDFAVMRLNHDGSLDSTYGENGKLVFDIDNRSTDWLSSVATLDDDRVIIAGVSENEVLKTSKIVLLRANKDGTIDKTFGIAGLATQPFKGYADVTSFEVQKNGNFLIGGSQGGGYYGYLARFLSNGMIDASFGVDGISTGGDFYYIEALKTLEDGRILAISDNNLYRFLPDGELDLTFGDKSRQILDWSTRQSLGIDQVAMLDFDLQNDGKILLGGYFLWYTDYYLRETRFAVIRLNADGSLDSTYGVNGTATAQFQIDPVTNQPIVSYAEALTLQADGKVLLSGVAYSVLQPSNNTDANIAMARFTPFGQIDPTFGEAGQVVTNVKGGSTDDQANAITTVQGDGKILTATVSSNIDGLDFAITRHHPDGSLDTSFNGQGWVKTDIRTKRTLEDGWYGPELITHISNDYPVAVAVQPDGKIILGGSSIQSVDQYENESLFVLVRYNSDGSLDHTFANNGILIQEGLGTQPGLYNTAPSNYMADMALQADGKIVITGLGWFDQTPPAPGYDFVTIRYNSDGTRDTSFGTDGIVITNGHTVKKNDYPSSLLIQPDGKIIVAGDFTGYYGSPARSITLIRYNQNGTLDTSFDGDGKISLAMTRHLYGLYEDFSLEDIALQEDGSIIAGGELCYNYHCYFILSKFLSDGERDLSFGYGGTGYSVLTYSSYFSSVWLNAISTQSDGRILAVGEISRLVRMVGAERTLGRPPRSKTYTSNDMIIMRLLPDGTFDYTFGELGGVVITDFAETSDSAYAITMQPDAKILVAGSSWSTTTNYYIEGHWDLALARYEGLSSPLDELEGIVFEIQDLADDAILNEGQAKSLSKHLEAAILQIDSGNTAAARNQLESFIKSVDTFVKTNIISEDIANHLKAVVSIMLDSLT